MILFLCSVKISSIIKKTYSYSYRKTRSNKFTYFSKRCHEFYRKFTRLKTSVSLNIKCTLYNSHKYKRHVMVFYQFHELLIQLNECDRFYKLYSTSVLSLYVFYTPDAALIKYLHFIGFIIMLHYTRRKILLKLNVFKFYLLVAAIIEMKKKNRWR